MVEAPTAPPTAPETGRLPLLAVVFVGFFGVLLASFPARNIDLWKYLADGRDLTRFTGGIDSSWLYSLAAYAVYSVAGGTGLAAVKALLCGAVAILMFHLATARGGWRIALAVTGLAVLAMSSRLLLQPATVSVLLLAFALWLLVREEESSRAEQPAWPGWRWVVLFVAWANVDARFVLGLAVVALVWFGRVFDTPPADGVRSGLRRWIVGVGVVVAAACLSPSHVDGLRVPPELRTGFVELRKGFGAESATVNSPFNRDYLSAFRDSPAALSYYPLLAVGLLSFLLNRRGWRWSWFLPWIALAVVSGIQVRLVPFFAVVAGPVTAWNLREFFARRPASTPVRRWMRYLGLGLASLLALAFVVFAWTGWLQGPPFEPRRWIVQTPVALPQGADFLRRAHEKSLWTPESRTLHVSPDTASAFAWFSPEDRGMRDEAVVELLLKPDDMEKPRERLRTLGVNRVVVYAGDPSRSSRMMLDRLLIDPYEWPVLHLTGGLVVFGWRDPARTGDANRYAGWEVDFTRLAFRPSESEVAPGERPPREHHWTDAFWKPAPHPRPPGRDEATVLLRKSEALLRTAPQRHIAAWEASQAVSLVGAASAWNGLHAPVDAALRLTLFQPPIPDHAPLPMITRLVFAIHQQFAFDRGHTPAGVLYAAIRAARRAVAENPDDANAYHALGRAYLALISTTAEQSWASQVSQLARVRQIQASAALNRAVALNPKLAQAHFELARLYLSSNCLDLGEFHLRAYRNIPARWGGPRAGESQTEAVDAELERLTKALERARGEFARESAQSSVSDRALMAARRGLAGEARDLLLKSDAAAFGKVGTELELDLLLRTGRPDNVLEWMAPEVRGSLGDFDYRWLRAQALIAVGEYSAADAELADMLGPGGRLPPNEAIAKEVAGLTGKSLLEEQPGVPFLSRILWQTFGRAEYGERINEISRALGRRADVLVVRGLVALEAGNIDRARESFRAALAYSPNRWGSGQLAFNGRRVAWECLALIEQE